MGERGSLSGLRGESARAPHSRMLEHDLAHIILKGNELSRVHRHNAVSYLLPAICSPVLVK